MTDWIRDRIRSFGDAPAISAQGQTVTYTGLDAAVQAWLTKLTAAGVAPGATVALLGDFSPTVAAFIIAALEYRLIVAPLPRGAASLASNLEATCAEVLVDLTSADAPLTTFPSVATSPLIERLRAEGAAGLIVLSSGSTGKPKASLFNFSLLIEKFREPRKPIRSMSFLMLDHIGGVNTLFTILSNGGLMVCPTERNPETICELIQTHQVQLLPVTPTFLKMLLISEAYRRFDLSSLEVVSFGTEPMPPSTLAALRRLLPYVSYRQLYGLTELGILPARSDAHDPLWIQFDGRAVETKVIDGTLWVRSSSAMIGYLNTAQPFDADGWFNTHDAVVVEGDRFRILGRASELINVGGEKVYPAAVEDVLLQMPGVRDVCVFAKRNHLTGQVVAARVWLDEKSDQAVFRDAVWKFCREHLAEYQRPMVIEFADGPLHGARFKKSRTVVPPAAAPC